MKNNRRVFKRQSFFKNVAGLENPKNKTPKKQEMLQFRFNFLLYLKRFWKHGQVRRIRKGRANRMDESRHFNDESR
jgi:hypothetical protein